MKMARSNARPPADHETPMLLKSLAKELLFPLASGPLRRKHARSVAVFMFHRILVPEHPEYARADPGYRFPPDAFRWFCGFLRRHFDVIDARQLLSGEIAARRNRPCALVTFDDGWRDNLELAADVALDMRVRPTVFIATEALDDPRNGWWQDALVRLQRSGRLADPAILRLAGPLRVLESRRAGTYEYLFELSAAIARLPESDRAAVKDGLNAMANRGESDRVRQIVRRSDLARLSAAFDLGVHGHSHTPMTHVADIEGEVRTSLQQLSEVPGALPIMAFPHGRYDARCIRGAFAAGAKALFTSDACLNDATDLSDLRYTVWGRISVDFHSVASRSGLSEAEVFFHLMIRRAVRVAVYAPRQR